MAERRLFGFQADNGSIAEAVIEETSGDGNDSESGASSNESATSSHDGSSSSTSTTSSDRREHELLMAAIERQWREADDIFQEISNIPGVISTNRDSDVFQEISNIPGVISTNRDSDVFQEILNIPGVASTSNDSDDDSSGNSDDDSTDVFVPVGQFSADPPPENQLAKVSWKEKILGNVDIAAILIGVGAIVGNFLV